MIDPNFLFVFSTHLSLNLGIRIKSHLNRGVLAGCGGVLRNRVRGGRLWDSYLDPFGLQDSNHAELIAIKHALQMFASSPYVGLKMIVELLCHVFVSHQEGHE